MRFLVYVDHRYGCWSDVVIAPNEEEAIRQARRITPHASSIRAIAI